MPNDGGRRPGRAPQILEELEDGLNVSNLDAISVALEAKQDTIPSGTYVPTNPVISGVVLDADGNWTSWTEAGVACSATYDPGTGNMATLTVAGVTRTFSYDANDNLIGAA